MPNFTLRRHGPKKNFYVIWTENGRSERRSTRTPVLALAQKWRENFVRDLLSTEQPDTVTVATVLHQYQDEKGIGGPSEKANDQAIRGFVSFYGKDMKVADLTPSKHIAYEKHCRTKFKHKASSINKRRNVLRAALNHAKKNGVLMVVPHVPVLSLPPRKERYLTRDEAAWMIREARRRKLWHLVLFIRIALYTAARHSAILELTWDRVDLEKGLIDFRDPDQPETKKRRPHAPANDRLIRLLRAVYKVRQGDHVIMHRGKPIGLIRKSFMDVARAVKLKGVSPHTLKHTSITWMLQNKITPWQVAGITATSVDTIIRIYGHHVQDDLRSAVNAHRVRDAQRTRNVAFM
jgi:integrase